MSSTQHQLIEQCATRLRGIVEALDNIHDNTPHRWSTDLDDVHSSAESLLALIKDQAPARSEASFEEWLANELEGEDGQPVPAAACDITLARRAFNHWPKLEQPAKVGGVRFSAGVSSRLVVEAAQRLYEFESTPEKEAERIDPEQESVEQAGGDERVIGWRERILAAHPNSDPGFWTDALLVEHMAAEIADLRAALAQPSPAQAEAERPEVVAWQYRVTAGSQTGWSLWHHGKGEEFERSYTVERRPLMTVAQHERIVGALRAVITQLRQHKNDYMDAGQETYRALQNEIREREAEIARLDGLVSSRTTERDAALAEIAQLEKKLAMALDAASKGDAARHAACGMEMEIQELKAKLAELEKQEPLLHINPLVVDELLGRAKRSPGGLTWSKGRCGSWTLPLYAAPVAQAQHSVPDGYRLIRLEHFAAIKAQLNPEQVDAYRGRNIYDEDKVYANWNACRSALDEIKDVFQQIDWDAENELAELLAAAPGKEVPQAWLDVQAERRRQITAEGWTPEHDDEHDSGELAAAGAAYALHAADHLNPYSQGDGGDEAPSCWPWHDGIAGRGEGPEKTEPAWWKPSTPRRDLVKACALALAEIERLDRAGISQSPQPGATTASS